MHLSLGKVSYVLELFRDQMSFPLKLPFIKLPFVSSFFPHKFSLALVKILRELALVFTAIAICVSALALTQALN